MGRRQNYIRDWQPRDGYDVLSGEPLLFNPKPGTAEFIYHRSIPRGVQLSDYVIGVLFHEWGIRDRRRHFLRGVLSSEDFLQHGFQIRVYRPNKGYPYLRPDGTVGTINGYELCGEPYYRPLPTPQRPIDFNLTSRPVNSQKRSRSIEVESANKRKMASGLETAKTAEQDHQAASSEDPAVLVDDTGMVEDEPEMMGAFVEEPDDDATAVESAHDEVEDDTRAVEGVEDWGENEPEAAENISNDGEDDSEEEDADSKIGEEMSWDGDPYTAADASDASDDESATSLQDPPVLSKSPSRSQHDRNGEPLLSVKDIVASFRPPPIFEDRSTIHKFLAFPSSTTSTSKPKSTRREPSKARHESSEDSQGTGRTLDRHAASRRTPGSYSIASGSSSITLGSGPALGISSRERYATPVQAVTAPTSSTATTRSPETTSQTPVETPYTEVSKPNTSPGSECRATPTFEASTESPSTSPRLDGVASRPASVSTVASESSFCQSTTLPAVAADEASTATGHIPVPHLRPHMKLDMPKQDEAVAVNQSPGATDRSSATPDDPVRAGRSPPEKTAATLDGPSTTTQSSSASQDTPDPVPESAARPELEDLVARQLSHLKERSKEIAALNDHLAELDVLNTRKEAEIRVLKDQVAKNDTSIRDLEGQIRALRAEAARLKLPATSRAALDKWKETIEWAMLPAVDLVAGLGTHSDGRAHADIVRGEMRKFFVTRVLRMMEKSEEIDTESAAG